MFSFRQLDSSDVHSKKMNVAGIFICYIMLFLIKDSYVTLMIITAFE